MLAFEMVIWWYSQGWMATAKNTKKALTGISKLFSVPILARTLFAPWKRIVTYPGASLDAKLRAYGDNIVSRAIGFIVRFLVLLAALVVSAAILIAGAIGFVAWPLIPPGAVLLILRGIF